MQHKNHWRSAFALDSVVRVVSGGEMSLWDTVQSSAGKCADSGMSNIPAHNFVCERA